MKKFTMTRKELEDFAVKALGLERSALRRMSTLFLSQLLQMNLSGKADAGEMVDEIAYLEGQYRGLHLGRHSGPASQKNTDAWVVFKRHHGTNYYLTLAKNSEGDRHINQRLHDAYKFDFPFLEEKHKLH